jgi:hypothetical protein
VRLVLDGEAAGVLPAGVLALAGVAKPPQADKERSKASMANTATQRKYAGPAALFGIGPGRRYNIHSPQEGGIHEDADKSP